MGLALGGRARWPCPASCSPLLVLLMPDYQTVRPAAAGPACRGAGAASGAIRGGRGARRDAAARRFLGALYLAAHAAGAFVRTAAGPGRACSHRGVRARRGGGHDRVGAGRRPAGAPRSASPAHDSGGWRRWQRSPCSVRRSLSCRPTATQLVLVLAGGATMTAALGPVAAVVVDVVHPGLRATAVSLLSVFQAGFGLAVGPVLAGALADRWGLTAVLATVPALGIAAAAALWWGSRSYPLDRFARSVTSVSPAPADHGAVAVEPGAQPRAVRGAQ